MFDLNKRYIFSKAKCKEWAAKRGEEWDEEAKQWTSGCDGQEVEVVHGCNGTICGLLIIPSWCDEVPNEEI